MDVTMITYLSVALGAALCILLVVVVLARTRVRPGSLALRERFGPEYERAVKRLGSRTKAERDLARRIRAVEALPIHPLDRAQHSYFESAWHEVQERFVDDPRTAVGQAQDLIKQVMHARGYPVHDFDERVELLSVDHARVVEHYREARALVNRANGAEPSTEDLRKAMVHCRALVMDLLSARGRPAPDAATFDRMGIEPTLEWEKT
jgi:hypothetical protein